MPESRAGGVYVGVYSKNEGTESAFQQASAAVQAFFSNVSAATARMGTQLAGMGAAIAAPLMSATIGIDNIMAVFRETKSFSSFGSALKEISERTNASAGLLSTLGHFAKLSGSDIGSMTNVLFQLNKNLGGASLATQKALASMGLTMKDLEGMTTDQKFLKITESLSRMKDEQLKTADAARIFGRATKDLLPLLTDAEGMKKMREETERLGIAMDDKAATAAHRLEDMMQRLRDSWEGVVLSVGRALAPSFEKMALIVTNLVTNFRKLLDQNPGMIQALNSFATGLVIAGGALLSISAASKGLEYLLSPGGLLAMGATAVILWSGALDGFLGDWRTFLSEFEIGGTKLGDWFGSIGQVLRDGLNIAGASLDKSFSAILARSEEMAADLLDVFGNLSVKIGEAIEGGINMAISGINVMIGACEKVVNYLTDMIDRIQKSIKGTLEIGAALGSNAAMTSLTVMRSIIGDKTRPTEFGRVQEVDLTGIREQVAAKIHAASDAMREYASGNRDRADAMDAVLGIQGDHISKSMDDLKNKIKNAIGPMGGFISDLYKKMTGTEMPDQIKNVFDMVTGLMKPFEEVNGPSGKGMMPTAPTAFNAVGTFSGAEAGQLSQRAGEGVQQLQLAEQRQSNKWLQDIAENGGQLVYEE